MMHLPMIATVPHSWIPFGKHSTATVTYPLRKHMRHHWMDESPTWDAFTHNFENHLSTHLQQIDLSNFDVNDLHHQLTPCLFQHFRPAPTTSESHSGTIVNFHTKWKHRRTLFTITQVSLQNLFRSWYHISRVQALSRLHRQHAKRQRALKLNAFFDQATRAANRHDSFHLYQAINALAPKQTRIRMTLKDSQGQLAHPIEEHSMLVHFVTQTWNTTPFHLPCFPDAPGVPFTADALIAELHHLKPMKASAPHCVPNLVWKTHATTIGPWLYQLLETNWNSSSWSIPTAWKDGWLKWIPKPGKPCTAASNMRPLSMLEPLGKVIMTLLTRSLVDSTFSSLCVLPQYAFLPFRSTHDAIVRVRRHCKLVAEAVTLHHRSFQSRQQDHRARLGGGFQIIIDLSRAFDTVDRQKLFRSLHDHGAPLSLVQLLQEWHSNTGYWVTHGGRSTRISTNLGLRQGCPAAPALSGLYVAHIFSVATHDIPMAWLLQVVTCFADDIHLGATFDCVQQMQEHMHHCATFIRVLQDFGLLVNEHKSKALVRLVGKDLRTAQKHLVHIKHGSRHLHITDQSNTFYIPLTHEVTYLGIRLTYHNMERCTTQHRIHCAWVTQRRLAMWLHRKKLPMALRIHLWQVSVFSSLTYGIWTVGCTPTTLHQLIHTIQHMLRKVLGDFSQHTRRTHQQAFDHAGIRAPEQLLLESALSFQRSIVQRNQHVTHRDIVLQGHWEHLTYTITLLQSLQVTGPGLRIAEQSQAGPHLTCAFCSFTTFSSSTLRRHLTNVHAQPSFTQCHSNPYEHALAGKPVCKHCHTQFTDWPAFRTHVNRNCCRMIAPPAQLEEDPALQHSTLRPADLAFLRGKDWSHDFLRSVAARQWEAIKTNIPACTILQRYCMLCGVTVERMQKMNNHHRTCHATLMDQVPEKAHELCQALITESPCRFCGKAYRTTHQCPVLTQVAILVCNNYGATTASPEHRCELCDLTFADAALLQEHHQTRHRRKQATYIAARDSVSGQPACAHCFSMHSTLEGLRRHITGGFCSAFNPLKEPELLPLNEELTSHLRDGNVQDYLKDADNRDLLTHQCLLCDHRYTRPGDLSLHLQSVHSSLYKAADTLVNLVNATVRSTWGCVCLPKVKTFNAVHNCLPVRQLCMHAKRCEDILMIPHSTDPDTLAYLLRPELPPDLMDDLQTVLARRTYSDFWQAPLRDALSSYCLKCATKHSSPALHWHLTLEHRQDVQYAQHYLPLIAQHIAMETTEDKCFACHMPFLKLPGATTGESIMTHFLAQCPCALQICLCLATAHHGAPRCGDGSSSSVPTLRELWQSSASLRDSQKSQKRPRAKPNLLRVKRPLPADEVPGDLGPPPRDPVERPAETGYVDLLHDSGSEELLGVDDCPRGPVASTGTQADATSTVSAAPAPGNLDGQTDPAQGCSGSGPSEDHCPQPENHPPGQHGPLPPVGSEGPSHGDEPKDEACSPRQGDGSHPGVPGLCERVGPDCKVPRTEGQPAAEGHHMAPPVEDEGRPPPRVDGDSEWHEHLAAGGSDLEGPQPPNEWPGPARHEPYRTWQPGEGWWKGFIREGEEQTAFQGHLRSLFLRLVLLNRSAWCYANATILALLWTLLSVKPPLVWGPQAPALATLLKQTCPVQLDEFVPFGPLFKVWMTNGEHGQADCTEFLVWVLQWLQVPACCINHRWERRYWRQNVVRDDDWGDAHTPLTLDFEDFHDADSVQLKTLVSLWHQPNGKCRALTADSQCINMQFDRFRQDPDQTIHKITCAVEIPEVVPLPVFMDRALTVEWVPYVPVACAIHHGDNQRGHYQALLLDHFYNISPWIITDDCYQSWRSIHQPEYLPKHMQSIWLVKQSDLWTDSNAPQADRNISEFF
eukprot:Skav230028  [mRNA]  locus=scaffold261:226175:231787:- [translate_table: standard]